MIVLPKEQYEVDDVIRVVYKVILHLQNVFFYVGTRSYFNLKPIIFMKKQITLFFTMFALVASISVFAQDKKMASPAAKAEGTIDGVKVTIDYHQPSAKGRKMLGGINPYGEVWRTGANASTSIEFNENVKIEGQPLPKGKYALFSIPGENEWTIIINKTIGMGAYGYKEGDDVLRVKVKPGKAASFVETFNIAVEKNNVVLKWENTQVAFKVSKG